MNIIDAFLGHFDVKTAGTISSEEIEAIERLYGTELPDVLLI
jgi:hypothetical protein